MSDLDKEEFASDEANADIVQEQTEEDSDRDKKNIWNRLLIAVIIIVAGLVALFCFLFYKRERYIDVSQAFSVDTELEGTTKAKTFAEDIAVGDNSVVIEGVTMSSSLEKALLADLDGNRIVFAQGIYDKTYPASLTKIMTAILAVQFGNMNDIVVMSEEDFDLEEGSQVSGMRPGDTVTMEQLFKTLLIYSANDAAMAIARHIGGSVENFAVMMNAEAKRLGMTGTHFVNPSGLHDDDHYTCAYDVYLMLNEAIKYTAFTDAIRMNVYNLTVTRADGSVISYRLDSTNKYLTGEKPIPYGAALWGGKTGTTPEAGSCLSLVMQNEKGIPFIAVILKADNSYKLYTDMTALLDCINYEF